MEIIHLSIVSLFTCSGKHIDSKTKGCCGIIIENLSRSKTVIIIILQGRENDEKSFIFLSQHADRVGIDLGIIYWEILGLKVKL